MSKFTCEKHPRLLVKFSNRSKVRFEYGSVEVSGETADRLEEFAKTHPEYGIEVAEREERETPKQALQREARERGLDDSGTVKDLEARIAAHDEDHHDQGPGDGDEDGDPVGEDEDPEDDDDNE